MWNVVPAWGYEREGAVALETVQDICVRMHALGSGQWDSTIDAVKWRQQCREVPGLIG